MLGDRFADVGDGLQGTHTHTGLRLVIHIVGDCCTRQLGDIQEVTKDHLTQLEASIQLAI